MPVAHPVVQMWPDQPYQLPLPNRPPLATSHTTKAIRSHVVCRRCLLTHPGSPMPGSCARISHIVTFTLNQSGMGMDMLGRATVRLRPLKLCRLDVNCTWSADTRSACGRSGTQACYCQGHARVQVHQPHTTTPKGVHSRHHSFCTQRRKLQLRQPSFDSAIAASTERGVGHPVQQAGLQQQLDEENFPSEWLGLAKCQPHAL